MANKKRIVIKVGTNVLLSKSSVLSRQRLIAIVEEITWLRNHGYQPVLVTSGAVGAGREKINLDAIKENAIQRQVFAAIGQVELMSFYRELFQKKDILISQALLIRDDFVDRTRYVNVYQTLSHLLDAGVVPIINENDVITTHESTFGDNDSLAANTAISISAECLILLTDIDGLYDSDPEENKNAQLLSEVRAFDKKIFELCFQRSSAPGMGGMVSKLRAAKLATSAGVTTYIANGLYDDTVRKIVAGEKIGTKFLPISGIISNRERWFLSGKGAGFVLQVDAGAKEALRQRKSLLLVGVKKVLGSFKENEIVEITEESGETIGYGMVNFSASRLQGHLSAPKSLPREVIHTDNLILV